MHAEAFVTDDDLNEMVARGQQDLHCPQCDCLLQHKTGEIWKCSHCREVIRIHLGARDPRVDPQPGDVLAAGSDVREVFERISGRIEYGFPKRAASRWLSLIQWQRWARDADVKKVAP